MNTVYLDLDGVLADFDTAIRDRGLENKRFDFTKLVIEEKLFVNLKPLPEIEQFKELISKYSNVFNFQILSSLGAPKNRELAIEGARQKKIWCEKHIPICTNFVVHKGLKKYFASPNAILVDDTEQNIWDFNEFHGTGILYSNQNQEPLKDINHLLFTLKDTKSRIFKL